jgi:DtxR family Mn-dependent transcriptional regulator
MSLKTKSTAAMEDYLEAILRLSKEDGVARVRDIASAVGVRPSTVSGALRNLGEKGLVNYRPYEVITLTPEGAKIAEKISRRYDLLSGFFRGVLGVPDEIADADACRLEHGLSRETVERLSAFMEFLADCPRTGRDWLEHFQEVYRSHSKSETCGDCFENWVKETRGKISSKSDRSRKKSKPGRRKSKRVVGDKRGRTA